ncbi:hypothetical protein CCR94_05455 [Rhodoblastus sphagnicola]|uniref:Hedgehog/Intein (Hint) domain-containing protein n=1 Tax=Rhodoblastus sphagnicola TaxID=333368 RepID=A0A2S6NCT7_9HYPH|nr:Hint domain-containing protein [Rhodoblastus sphagnicola]MBB4196270.1 hypothetical protein [Rhodoblastus sphagnicola]PPQ32414.1 hypothetical protein CCR94_05455 [Rhodoblastus sphagnicola]
MTDYVWGPITVANGVYTWRNGQINWNTSLDWLLGPSLNFSAPMPGDAPGSGLGGSDGSLDNVTLVAGELGYQFLMYSFPYSTNFFRVDVVIDSGSVAIDTLTLAGFNGTADRYCAQWPTLEVRGATLVVNGSIGDSSSVNMVAPAPTTISASGGGVIALSGGATVQVAGAVPSDIEFVFGDGANNKLSLGTVTSSTIQTIFGLVEGDSIDLTSVKYTGGQPQLSFATLVDLQACLTYVCPLSVTENGVTYSFNLDSAASGKTFLATADASGEGTLITVVACYRRGARIATERGEVAVEDLRVGDVAVTANGGRRPVRWIGWRRLGLARDPDPRAVWPVRIAAHAFGEDRPRRDLWVSPGHNIFVDGALIPAIALANGVTIEQVALAQVEYYHVELDAHDILLAENLPAESYLDCGNRAAFANHDGAVQLFPDFAPKCAEGACHPLRKSGTEVEAAKAALLARVLALGHGMTRDPDLHLLADGVAIEPARRDGGRVIFDIPADARALRLKSRVWTPAHMIPASADDRALGVLVTRLEIDGVAQDLSALGEGWREVESSVWRWTDGDAALPGGARAVAVETDGAPLYWNRPGDAARDLFGAACLSA